MHWQNYQNRGFKIAIKPVDDVPVTHNVYDWHVVYLTKLNMVPCSFVSVRHQCPAQRNAAAIINLAAVRREILYIFPTLYFASKCAASLVHEIWEKSTPSQPLSGIKHIWKWSWVHCTFYYYKILHSDNYTKINISCPVSSRMVSSVLLGEHGSEGRQVFIHRRVRFRGEVFSHVTRQAHEHTVWEELQRRWGLVNDQRTARGFN